MSELSGSARKVAVALFRCFSFLFPSFLFFLFLLSAFSTLLC